MKVICKDVDGSFFSLSHLTIGKIYDVVDDVDVDDRWTYLIKNDKCVDVSYSISHFYTMDEYRELQLKKLGYE